MYVNQQLYEVPKLSYINTQEYALEISIFISPSQEIKQKIFRFSVKPGYFKMS